MEKSKYSILRAECITKLGIRKVILYGSPGQSCDNIEDFRQKLKANMSTKYPDIDIINLTYEERD